jgi:phosphatidylglycerol:prolipoprotein diacylglycerol transferase
MIAMFAGIIGARIFYVIQFHEQFEGNLLGVFRIDQGGLVFYGGFLLSAFVLFVYCKVKKINIARLLDVFAPAVALGHAFGRIGCFMQGCCFGKPGNAPFCVVFPSGSAPAARFPQPSVGEELLKNPPSLPLYPTQLIEAGVNFLLFFILFNLVGKIRKGGRIAGLYLFCYALLRFLMEYFRGDHTDFTFGLFTPSQTVALFFTAPLGLLMIFTAGKWGKNGAPDLAGENE